MPATFDLFTEVLNECCYAWEGGADGVTVTHCGPVYLYGRDALPENYPVTFSNRGYVYLSELATLPENYPVTFSNGGPVNLGSLTALPENYPVTFSNSGYVYLNSISPEPQFYQGKLRRFCTIDGWPMLLEYSRKVGDCTIHKARYFRGGPVAEMPQCYLAQDGDVWAHGNTIAEAVRDLRFKIAQVDYDADDLIAEVKRSGVITWLQFRLLTGACEAGLRQGLVDLGLSPDIYQLPLVDAMRYVAGRYGEARMREAFGGAA